MNFNLLHEVVLVAMALLFAVAIAVIIERLIYYIFVDRSRKLLVTAMASRNPLLSLIHI